MTEIRASSFESRLRKEISDITECPICTDTLRDPRSLPCLHSFCLKCLISYGVNKQAGDILNCPVCRKAFTLTDGGLQSLPVTHFINKLIDVNSMKSQDKSETWCEVCLGVELNEQAVGYCLECREHLCRACLKRHGVQKFFKSHKTVGLDEKPERKELMKLSVNQCYQHMGEVVKFYCHNCKKTACVICYVSDHKEHKCTDISKAAVELTQRLDGDAIKIKQYKTETVEVIKQIKSSMVDLCSKASDVRDSLASKYIEIKRHLDLCFQQATDKAKEIEQNRKKELETLLEESEFEIIAMNDLNNFWEELKDKGTPADISESAANISERTEELLSRHEENISNRNFRSKKESFKFTFHPTELQTENILGDMSEDTGLSVNFCPDWRVLLTDSKVEIRSQIGNEICGLAIHDNVLFLICTNYPCIFMYNIKNSNSHTATINISNNEHPLDIVCCSTNEILYFSTRGHNRPGWLHRINMKSKWLGSPYQPESKQRAFGGNQNSSPPVLNFIETSHLSWTVENGQPVGLSVTKNLNILVSAVSNIENSGVRQNTPFRAAGFDVFEETSIFGAFPQQGAVKPVQSESWILEYNTDGILLRNIQQNGHIQHAVELSNETYAICSSTPVLTVSIVDRNGRTISTVQPKVIAAQGQRVYAKVAAMGPTCNQHNSLRMAVDQLQNLLVSDPNKNNLYILSSKLDYVKCIEGLHSNQGLFRASTATASAFSFSSNTVGNLNQFQKTCCCWDEHNKCLFFGTKTGVVLALQSSR